jgi:hypothetical protein
MKIQLTLIIALFILTNAKAQQLFPTFKVINGDTIHQIQLNEAVIVGKRAFDNDTARYNFNQMKYNIKMVLPYAIEGIKVFREIDSVSFNMSSGDKRRYIKSREKEVRAKLEDKLKKLNITQGRLLVKIMNRQLRTTCYETIKYLHNPVKAAAYRSYAKLNGIDLDENYDPEKNKDFENIMRRFGQ